MAQQGPPNHTTLRQRSVCSYGSTNRSDAECDREVNLAAVWQFDPTKRRAGQPCRRHAPRLWPGATRRQQAPSSLWQTRTLELISLDIFAGTRTDECDPKCVIGTP